MSATPLPDPPSAATVDLSGDEAPVQTFRRITGGIVLMLVFGVAALALFAAYIGGAFIPAIADWVDLFGDGLLYVAAIAAGIAITGFELLRRGRNARDAATPASAGTAVASTLAAVGGVTTEPGDTGFGETIPDPGETPGPTGSETHL